MGGGNYYIVLFMYGIWDMNEAIHMEQIIDVMNSSSGPITIWLVKNKITGLNNNENCMKM